MSLSDKYGRARTDLEDFIESHKECCAIYAHLKALDEESGVSPPRSPRSLVEAVKARLPLNAKKPQRVVDIEDEANPFTNQA